MNYVMPICMKPQDFEDFDSLDEAEWENLTPNTGDPTIVNNTGNFDFTRINITGQNLTGKTHGQIIYAGNITVNITDNAQGVSMEANISVPIDHANLTHGAPNIGNLTLYFYIDVPTGFKPDVYNVSTPWEITLE